MFIGIRTVLVFKKEQKSDSYMIGWGLSSLESPPYIPVGLSCCGKWGSLELAAEGLTIYRNGFILTDTIPYRDLEMRRVAEYGDWQDKN